MTAVEATVRPRPLAPSVWVGIVLAIGLGAGAVLALVVHVPPGPPPPPGGSAPPAWWAQLGVVLSTSSIVLLCALLLVYVRGYRTTRAPYTLGLVIFLSVLLLETLASSPLLFRAFGEGPGALGRFLDVGGLLMNVALTIFLYLSLQ